VGFQKDCNWIYTGSEDGSVKICDLRANGYQRSYYNKEAINTVVIHPNEVDYIFFFSFDLL
jgi:WD40 repeat protein